MLYKHLNNLHDAALLEYFHEFCIKAVATFDARQEYQISEMANIIDSLSTLPMENVLSRLEVPMSSYVEKVLVSGAQSLIAWTLKLPPDQLQYLSNLLESFCVATLKIISDKFGHFGLVIWAPMLAKMSLQVGLKKYVTIKGAHEAEHYGGTNSQVEFYENSFLVYIQVHYR